MFDRISNSCLSTRLAFGLNNFRFNYPLTPIKYEFDEMSNSILISL